MSEKQIYGSVLLVCIYNRYGNVITHDYFYQLFSPFGDVVKILIFQKAKVWKTFVEFSHIQSARMAMIALDNRVVFQDGSKMNIFSSKLKHVKLQNCNLGGVNYEELRVDGLPYFDLEYGIRNRANTNPDNSSIFYLGVEPEKIQAHKQKYEEETKHSLGSLNKDSSDSFTSFSIDQQFLQLARQSEQFRKLEVESQNQEQKIRLKSKTMITNPNLQLFLKENSPCKVLFVRSIPSCMNTRSLYNIFSNFGPIRKIVCMKEKGNALIEFCCLEDAIVAKDELNYAKAEMKIFYSHYDALNVTQQNEGQIFQTQKKQSRRSLNPPTQILYLTFAIPEQQNQIREKCRQIGVQIYNTAWTFLNNRWTCLIDFGTVDNSLLVVGLLQGVVLESGRPIKFSFTRQRLSRSN